jgi:hypothetical protein
MLFAVPVTPDAMRLPSWSVRELVPLYFVTV